MTRAQDQLSREACGATDARAGEKFMALSVPAAPDHASCVGGYPGADGSKGCRGIDEPGGQDCIDTIRNVESADIAESLKCLESPESLEGLEGLVRQEIVESPDSSAALASRETAKSMASIDSTDSTDSLDSLKTLEGQARLKGLENQDNQEDEEGRKDQEDQENRPNQKNLQAFSESEPEPGTSPVRVSENAGIPQYPLGIEDSAGKVNSDKTCTLIQSGVRMELRCVAPVSGASRHADVDPTVASPAAPSGDGWAEAENILCVRLDSMGDVLMCTPAMRAIAQSAPERRLTLLSSASGVAVSPFIPELDAAICCTVPWIKNGQASQEQAAGVTALAQTLRAQAFDGAVIFTSYSQSALPAALLCYLADIPLRIAHCRENPYQLLTGWVPEPEPQQAVRHEVRRQLDLASSIGCRPDSEKLSFALRSEDLASMRRRMAAAAAGLMDGKRWVLVHPGASAASRRYPPGHWSQLIAAMHRQLGVNIVLTGDAGEAELIANIVSASGLTPPAVLPLAGELDLGRLGAAISLAAVVIANNTGPAHMAAAIGTPLVDLYALTNPQHTPWQVESRVLFHDVACRFCYRSICPQGHHDCLAKVDPMEVLAAVRSLLPLWA